MVDEIYKLGEIRLFTEEQVESKIMKLTYEKAPLIIHQRFCHELVVQAKKHPKEVLKKIPEAMNILIAIRKLEEFYPKLKSK